MRPGFEPATFRMAAHFSTNWATSILDCVSYIMQGVKFLFFPYLACMKQKLICILSYQVLSPEQTLVHAVKTFMLVNKNISGIASILVNMVTH